MSYSDNKGKYQKAYDFLYKKLVPSSGKAKNALGEALRLVSRAYYRKNNDGDSELLSELESLSLDELPPIEAWQILSRVLRSIKK